MKSEQALNSNFPLLNQLHQVSDENSLISLFLVVSGSTRVVRPTLRPKAFLKLEKMEWANRIKIFFNIVGSFQHLQFLPNNVVFDLDYFDSVLYSVW